MGRSRRRRVVASGAALLIVLGAWWLWPTPPSASPEAPPPPEGSGPTLAVEAQAAALAEAPAARAPEPEPEPPRAAPPVIDEVTVEKAEVCEGEENLVTVKAHTVDGTDPFLHYVVGSAAGQRVPVRVWRDDDGEDEAPPLEVKVFGKHNVSATAPVPPYVVKDCEVARWVAITPHLRANTWSEFDFEAQLREHAPGTAPARVREWRWTFGDGEKARTEVPRVTHTFEGRRQDTEFAQVLVTAEARLESGESVVGRLALQLINPAFEDFATKGVVTLQLQLTPRFPELDRSGRVRQRVRLFHHRDRPVSVGTVSVFRHRRGDEATPRPEAMSPEALWGSSTVPPGRGVEFDVALDTRAHPDVFSVEYLLEGKDADGNPARGAFSVMRPPELPTKENSEPVRDEALKAKILEARRLLGRPYVTDEDLMRLEREGRFAGLALPAPRPADPRDVVPARQVAPPGPGPTATGTEPDATAPAKRP